MNAERGIEPSDENSETDTWTEVQEHQTHKYRHGEGNEERKKGEIIDDED